MATDQETETILTDFLGKHGPPPSGDDPYLRQDVSTLTHKQATERLAQMKTDYEAAAKAVETQRVAKIERDAAAKDYAARASGKKPMTPDAAAQRLAQLEADPEWQAKFMANDAATLSEWKDLAEAKASGPLVDSILDGTALAGVGIIETVSGGLSIRNQIEQVNDLRARGYSDEEAREYQSKTPISPAEHDAADRAFKILSSDPEWGRRLTSGDYATTGEWTRLCDLLSRPIAASV